VSPLTQGLRYRAACDDLTVSLFMFMSVAVLVYAQVLPGFQYSFSLLTLGHLSGLSTRKGNGQNVRSKNNLGNVRTVVYVIIQRQIHHVRDREGQSHPNPRENVQGKTITARPGEAYN